MLFPLYYWTQIEETKVQQVLQTAFEHWGLPDVIRFDNGRPWANSADRVPTSLALWLVGLGIQPIFGRPHRSTDNAVVERSHYTLDSWVDPETCSNYETLARKLAYFANVQRCEYPSCNRLTRLQAYPTLLQARRPYDRHQDEQLWDIQRVYQYVAQFRLIRTPDKNGRISILTTEYSVGRTWAGKQVTCWLEPDAAEWVIENQWGEIVKRLPVRSLDYPTIASLLLKYRRKR